ncbi:hypothetical protein PIB30_006850 [Stylosanthes scabra]|uniref:Uncharacterized protein n=1 Tax=Stylosanthes scabra TaxID=79078 RepID=A0ABU6V482_9FABA|nr:hypothetical protein [Stylosanthes scabra]
MSMVEASWRSKPVSSQMSEAISLSHSTLCCHVHYGSVYEKSKSLWLKPYRASCVKDGNVPDEQDRGGEESCILAMLVELNASMGEVGKSLMKRIDEHQKDAKKLSCMTEEIKALSQSHEKEAEQLREILAELRRNTTIVEACLDAFV